MMDPWWFRMTSRQRYKPTPAASAVGFVVKNGSNILALMLSSMPDAVVADAEEDCPVQSLFYVYVVIGVKSFFCNFFSNA